MKNYLELKSELGKGDSNCCGVIALAVVTGVDPVVAQAALAKAGRARHSGTYQYQLYAGCKSLGFECEVIVNPGGRNDEGKRVTGWKASRTIRTLQRVIPKRGAFLVHTAGHVLAIKDGNVCDWTADRLMRIKKIVKVTKK